MGTSRRGPVVKSSQNFCTLVRTDARPGCNGFESTQSMSLPIEQSLSKARRHAKRGETDLAAEIYRRVLEKYPQNRKAQAGLKGLGPSSEQMNALIALYTSGQLEKALAEGEALAARFPAAAFVPNLLGAVNAGLGRLDHGLVGLGSEIGPAGGREGDHALVHLQRAIAKRSSSRPTTRRRTATSPIP